MIEVEIKLPLFRRSITERALTDCGFKAGNLVKESDFYFTSDFHDFMKTDEALRIRTCENFTTRETTSFLTYKGAKLDTVSTTRKELETRIEDADIARRFLSPWLQKAIPSDKASPVLPQRPHDRLRRPGRKSWLFLRIRDSCG